MSNSKTMHTEIDELTLREHLHKSEEQLKPSVIQSLADGRAYAIAQESRWLKGFIQEYRGLFSATVATAALVVVMIIPLGNSLLSDGNSSFDTESSVTLLMEDPEFYLWLNESGMLVAER